MAPGPDELHRSAPPTPPAAAPIRPSIAAARRHGDSLITSGQTAVRPDGSLVASGRVGEDVDLETARICAWQCAANVLTAAKSEIGSLESIAGVTRLTVYVASAATFTEQHLVADVATRYLHDVLGEDVGVHARAAIGVAALPTGSPVEVEATFRLTSG